MKKLLLVFMTLFLWAGSSWGITVTIGTGTLTARYPLNDYYVYSRSQCIYLASEITTGGTITVLRWYRNDVGADPNAIGTTEIWLKETASATVANGTWEDPGTLVATISNIDLGAGGGWYSVDITDFAYGGTNNLLVSVRTQNAPYTSPHSYWRYTSTSTNYRSRLGNSDSVNPPTMSISYSRPNIQLDITTTSPNLSALPGTMNFGFVPSGGTYEYPTPYQLSGTNLTTGPIVVTAPTGFEVSLTGGGVGFGSSVNVTYTPPTLGATNIYVRFLPSGPPASYSGNITNVGGGASTNVAVSGTSYFFQWYCTSYATSTADEDIFNVTVGSLNNSSTCVTTGDFGSVLNLYSNYTLSVSPPNLGQTGTINFSLSSGTCGGNYSNAFKIFIDYNIDGDFADSGEQVYVSAASTSGPHTETGSFVVPGTATLGTTMMRVINVETGTPSGITACGTYSWGETEDYLVTIASPPACIAPSSPTTTNITTVGADFGWSSIDSFFDIFYDVAGAPAPGPSSTPNVDNWNATSYTWTGGSPSTSYDWYVRTDCAAGGGTGQSDWTGPQSFTTTCVPLSIPHTENFDSGVEWPTCWSEIGNAAVWQIYNNYLGSGSGYQAYADYSPIDQGILHSPEFDGTTKNNLHVRFLNYWKADYASGNQDGYFYGSPDGGTTPYLIDEWHHLNPATEFAWKEYDISSWADGASNITFWWDLDMNDDWYWVFDYFTIQEGAFGTSGLWTGAVDNDWHNTGNWDDNTVPFANISVIIPTGLSNYPTLSAAGYCFNLYMNADATGYATLLDGGFLTLGGTANIQSYITADVWHFIGPPVTGATANIFHLTGSQPDVYLRSFDETTNTYTDIVPVATPLNAMEGYAVWVDGLNVVPPVASWTFTYPGALNTGAFGSADNMTRTIDGDNGGNNLLANPYPSGIDWDAAAGWTKTNMMDAYYIEDNGGWATYVSGSGIGTFGVIAPGQGFFVFVNNGGAPTTGTLMMDNSVRVHTATPFIKDAVANLVRLEVQGNNKTDETVVRFLEEATALFDGNYDAFKLEPTDGAIPQLYSVTDKDVAINSLPETDWVQLGFKANFDGEYTISAIEINDIPSVWLEDTFTGEFTNLTTDSYTFNHSVINAAERFILHFTPLAVPENFSDMINIYSNNHDVYVAVPANTRGTVKVYNLMGQEAASSVITGVLTRITLDKSAYYVVEVVSDESVVTKKVFVK